MFTVANPKHFRKKNMFLSLYILTHQGLKEFSFFLTVYSSLMKKFDNFLQNIAIALLNFLTVFLNIKV